MRHARAATAALLALPVLLLAAAGGDDKAAPPVELVRPRPAPDTSGEFWHVVFDVAAGDLDGNGKPDLAVSSPDTGKVLLFAGPIPRSSGSPPLAPAVVVTTERGAGMSGNNGALLVADLDPSGGRDELVVGNSETREALVFRDPLSKGKPALGREDAAARLFSAAFGAGSALAASRGGRETELAVAGATRETSRVFFASGAALEKSLDLDARASRVLSQLGARALCENVGWDVEYADFDGDEVPEFVASSPRAAGASGEPSAGRIDVWRRADPRAALEPRATLFGKEPRSRFGRAFALLDFDRDGRLDVATCSSHARRRLPGADGTLAAREARNVGEVYLVPNRLLRDGSKTTAADPAIKVLHGSEHDERFGWTILAGDFDGDRSDDLLVSGKFAAAPGGGESARGRLYFVSNALLRDPRPWEAARRDAAIVLAPEGVRHFGMCGAVADFDGDGYDDAAVGGMSEDGSGVPVGRLVIVHGAPGICAAGGSPPRVTVLR